MREKHLGCLKLISGEKIFSIFCAAFSGVFPNGFIASNKRLVSLKSLTCHQIHVTILELWLPWENVQDGRSFIEEVGALERQYERGNLLDKRGKYVGFGKGLSNKSVAGLGHREKGFPGLSEQWRACVDRLKYIILQAVKQTQKCLSKRIA